MNAVRWTLIPFLVVGLTFALARCGDPEGVGDEDIITEQALAVMLSSALFSGTGTVSAQRRKTFDSLQELLMPSAWAVAPACPTVKSGVCRTYLSDSVSEKNATGDRLKLFRDHCTEGESSQRGTWRSYVVTQVPSSAKFTSTQNCEAARKTGFTTAYVSDQGLVGKTFRSTYGLGPNGDQQNIWVDSGMILRTIYSDFPSGGYEKEPSVTGERGGVEYTYTKAGTLNRTVRVTGMHIVGYKRYEPDKNTTPEGYIDAFLANKNVGYLHWDRTFATEDKGDRKFENGDAAVDKTTVAAPLVIREEPQDRRIESGILRIQNNYANAAGKVSFGRSEVKNHLKFGDPNCNCPDQGQLTTTYSRLNAFRFPVDVNGEYDAEDFDFGRNNGDSCGDVKVTRWLDGKRKMHNQRVHLYMCD